MPIIKKNDDKITCIKEKYATLRIYTTSKDEYVLRLLDFVDSLSATIYEKCGRPACIQSFDELSSFSWEKTLCETHAKERRGEFNILK